MTPITDPEILAKLEGGRQPISDPALLAKLDEAPSLGSDLYRGVISGVEKGVAGLGGLPGDVAELGAKGIDYATQFVGKKFGIDVKPRDPNAAPMLGFKLPNTQEMIEGGDRAAKESGRDFGTTYKPQTTPGKYTQAISEFLPGMIGGPGGLARKFITGAALPGAGMEAGQQLTEGTKAEPYGAIAGALLGGLSPALAMRAATPLPISAERMRAVNTLRNEGVSDLTAGQVTGRRGLQYMESELAGGRVGAKMENQGEQFTSASLAKAGEQASRATPEVIDGAFKRIGQNFDDLASRNVAVMDTRFGNDLVRTQRNYEQLVPQTQRAPIVEGIIKDIGNMAAQNNGALDGAIYQAMRSRLDKAARGSKFNDPQLSEALYGIRNSLDSAMERSIIPADRAAWKEARKEYKNLLVLEKAATASGEGAAMGLISPSQLRAATAGQNRRAYARGQGDFPDLARSGEALMKPLPQSGTAPRLRAQNLGIGPSSIIGAVAGGSAGGSSGDPTSGVLGAIAGALAPKVAGRILMSKPAQGYLANQQFSNQLRELDPKRAAIINALLASGQLRGAN